MFKGMDKIFAIGLIVTTLLCALLVLIGIILIPATLTELGNQVASVITEEPGKNDLTGISETEAPLIPTPTMMPTSAPRDEAAFETLNTLINTMVPSATTELVLNRFEHQENIPLALTTTPPNYDVGARRTFWAGNTDTNEDNLVSAVLQYETAHAYWWIQEGLSFNPDSLRQIAETFENEIYPTDRAFFGSEWSPGVDNDIHLHILFAQDLGASVAGYFPTDSELPTQIYPHSNMVEMFMMSMDNGTLEDPYTYGVLAHEFTHMIQFNQDRNESTWFNEGFADLGTFINGYDPGGFDARFMGRPDLQLNTWSDSNSSAHYGASFSFINYFYNRFGEEATMELSTLQENGLESIDTLLESLNTVDMLRNEPFSADGVFTDWTIANFLNDPLVEDGRFSYPNYPGAPTIHITDPLDCDGDWFQAGVNQFGTDYYRVNCSTPFTLEFTGETTNQVVPADPHSGNYMFYSNEGDDSLMTLQHTFDFTDISAPIMMEYWMWYDIENDYDYLYLMASTDGEQWEMINPAHCTSQTITDSNRGCGYTNTSGGWVLETLDLSQFAGQQVTISFDYLTDPSLNGEGFLVDDISIPAISYSSDFEADTGGWTADGFVRIQNRLPQTYSLTIIQRHSDLPATVQFVYLTEDQRASVEVDPAGGEVFVIVSGTARFIQNPTEYQIRAVPN